MFDRRVTFDKAVWTKPLASAADAAPQLCPFNRTDHECADVAHALPTLRRGDGDADGVREGGVVGICAERG